MELIRRALTFEHAAGGCSRWAPDCVTGIGIITSIFIHINDLLHNVLSNGAVSTAHNGRSKSVIQSFAGAPADGEGAPISAVGGTKIEPPLSTETGLEMARASGRSRRIVNFCRN